MPVFALKCFPVNSFLSLVLYFTAKKKKKNKDPSSPPPAIFCQKCNPLRPVVGNAMYPDYEVQEKQNSFPIL